MNKWYARFPPIAFSSLWGLLLTACEPVEHPTTLLPSRARPILGHWRYDSARTVLYSADQVVEGAFVNAMPAKALLLITPTQWRYAGSLQEEHVYTRQGDTLIVCRVGDTHLVDQHYISPAGVGKIIGNPDTLLITSLTPHRFIVEQRMKEPGGSTRICYLYHSR